MNSNERYPVRVEHYNGVSVTLYEIDGKEHLIAEDIGHCLGLIDPKRAVKKIYSRNREELDAHKGVVKLTTPGGPQKITTFTETGANLIGMFSRTPKAKAFRQWLARLPRKVREGTANSYARGLEDGFNLLARLPGEGLGPEELGQIVTLRRLSFTQEEAGAHLGLTKYQVQRIEERLKEMGITFPPVRKNQRRRKFRAALAAAAGPVPAPPMTPKQILIDKVMKGEVSYEPSPR